MCWICEVRRDYARLAEAAAPPPPPPARGPRPFVKAPPGA